MPEVVRLAPIVAVAWALSLPGWLLPPRTLAEELQGFLQLHCVTCHGGAAPEGGLSLERGPESFTQSASHATWVRIHDRVKKHEMPPRVAAQPEDRDRVRFLAQLYEQLHRASLARQQDEGRVVVRRLNRYEYEHTLHDLLGVATDVKSLLPDDTVVAGFDKVSSGLETSATHLVRYQQAADLALADALPSAIVIERPITHRLTGREYLDGRPAPNRAGTEPFVQFEGPTIVLCARLYKHGSVATAPTPVRGRYRVRASVGAVRSQGKPIPVLMGKMSSDRFAEERLEHILAIQDAPASGRRVVEFEAILQPGEQVYLEGQGLTFFGDLKKQLNDRPVGAEYEGPGLAVDWIEWTGPLDAGEGYRRLYGGLPRVPQRFLADALQGKSTGEDWSRWHPNEFSKPHNRLRLVSRDPRAEADRLIRDFVPRAFRRPADPAVVDRYVHAAFDKLDQGHPLDEVLTETYKEILCSPHFLFLVEQPGMLDDHALATRLSYFLWDGPPDEELRTAAERGVLGHPDVLRAQTERLLSHPKVSRFVEAFTGQWLDLRKIHDMKPDVVYVEYDWELAWSMPEETRRFFVEVLARDLPTSTFLHSDWTMLNARLAQHYQLNPIDGMDLRRVTLPGGSRRGGVVTHASILKLTTNATYTSPVKRGVWVLERLLGTPPSPPPPSVAAIEPDIRGAVTIREQLAKHQAVATCAACHRHIDPPGFALENFDVVGGWRERYRSKDGGEGKTYAELPNYAGRKVWLGRPVESAGELASGDPFADVDAWKRLTLREPDQLTRNLAEKLLVYATGGAPQFADREVVEEIVERTRERNHGFRSLIHEVVQSRVFRAK